MRDLRLKPRFALALTIAAAVVLGAGVLPGCRRVKTPPPYSSMIPPDAEVPGLPLKFERAGTLEAGVGNLHGIAIDSADRVYAVGSSGVRVLDAAGNELASWKLPEDGWAVAAADDGTVYVGLASKILKFDRQGKELGAWGVEGSGAGQLRRVTSVVVSGEGVFVADARNLCINRYTPGGDFMNDIGRRDRQRDIVGLIAPSPYLDFVIDKQGRVVVGNPGRGRVETYTTDGKFLDTWGEPGLAPDRFSGCCNPTNLALTSEGNIVTAEKGLPRVKVCDPTGRMLAYIPQREFPPDAAGMDLAVDSKDRIYVADPVNGRIMIFAPVKAKE